MVRKANSLVIILFASVAFAHGYDIGGYGAASQQNNVTIFQPNPPIDYLAEKQADVLAAGWKRIAEQTFALAIPAEIKNPFCLQPTGQESTPTAYKHVWVLCTKDTIFGVYSSSDNADYGAYTLKELGLHLYKIEVPYDCFIKND